MSAKAKTRKIMAQGVGESKLHSDPHAPSVYAALAGLHVGCMPIEELPEEMVARLCYQHTDEAIAERNAGKVDSAARVTSDPLDKSIQQRRDFRTHETQPWEAPDPMKDLADHHTPPGMKAKFLSPAKCDREGTRGFQVVKDKLGNLVKLGRMMLGIMPIEKSKARGEFYRAKGAERLQRIEHQNEELQRAVRAGDSRPFALAGESLDAGDGLHSSREEEFD